MRTTSTILLLCSTTLSPTVAVAAPAMGGAVVSRSVQDGAWSDAATWDHAVPEAGQGIVAQVDHSVDVVKRCV